jgi:hypothetical protein
MIHRSKKDWWLVSLVVASVVLPLLFGAFQFISPGGDRQSGWSALLIGTTTGAVVLLLTYPLYYEVTASALIIRCGIMRHSVVPIWAIREARPSRNPLSAPAWSLDRVRVVYRVNDEPRFAIISPEDKTAFMHDLVAADAGLQLRGERVVRVP